MNYKPLLISVPVIVILVAVIMAFSGVSPAIIISGAFFVLIICGLFFGIPALFDKRSEERIKDSVLSDSKTLELPLGSDMTGAIRGPAEELLGGYYPSTIPWRALVSKDGLRFIHALGGGEVLFPPAVILDVTGAPGRVDFLLTRSYRITFIGGFSSNENTEPFVTKAKELLALS